eukprot:scaffold204593_cov56-Attheya_sp.AAC.2
MEQSSVIKASGDAAVPKRPVAALEMQTAASADDSPSVCELVSLRIDRLLGGSSASAPYPTLSQMHMEPPRPPKRAQSEDDMDDSHHDRKRKANRNAKDCPSNRMEPPQKVARLSKKPGSVITGRTEQIKDQKPEPQKKRADPDPVITTEAPQIVNTRRSSRRHEATKEVHDSSNNSGSNLGIKKEQEQSLKVTTPRKSTRLRRGVPAKAAVKHNGKASSASNLGIKKEQKQSVKVKVTTQRQTPRLRGSVPAKAAVKQGTKASTASNLGIKKEQEKSLRATRQRKPPRRWEDMAAKAAIKQSTKASSASNLGIKKEQKQSLKVTAQRKTLRLQEDAPAKAAIKQHLKPSKLKGKKSTDEEADNVSTTSTQQKEWKNKLRTRETKPIIKMVLSDEETEEERAKRLQRRRLKFWDDWDEGFRALVEFKKVHGHTIVPFEAGKLSKWANSMQRQKSLKEKGYTVKAYALTPERIKKLNKIGFAWKKWRESEWDECYEKLKAYKKIHNHTRVPRNHEVGRWTESQRQQYRKRQENVHHFLTEARIKKLNKLDFKWTLLTPWKESFDKLVEWKKQHGHVTVPQKSKPLGSWCRTQRFNYHVFQSGGKTSMTPDNILALEKLGFAWVDPRSKGK